MSSERTAKELGSPILTPEEAVIYLRLRESGSTNPLRTLAYYRTQKGLKATRFGRKAMYHIDELARFASESMRSGPEVGDE